MGRGCITLGLKAAGSFTIMNWRALNTALSVSVRFSQSWHKHASLQNSPAHKRPFSDSLKHCVQRGDSVTVLKHECPKYHACCFEILKRSRTFSEVRL